MTSAVLFDFGGTLDADGRRWSERFHRGYRDRGGAARAPHLRGLLPRIGPAPDGAIRGLGVRVSGDGVRPRSGCSRGWCPTPPASTGGLDRRFRVGGQGSGTPRNRPLLTELGKRFELGVISNFTGNLRPCLRELEIEDCFSVVFDSGGSRRPQTGPPPVSGRLRCAGPPAGGVLDGRRQSPLRHRARRGARLPYLLARASRAAPGGDYPDSPDRQLVRASRSYWPERCTR